MSRFDDDDRAFMARALELAERGLLHDDAQSARRLRDRARRPHHRRRLARARRRGARRGARAGRCAARGDDRARRDRLRDAGAVQPSGPHAAVHRRAARRRRRARGRRDGAIPNPPAAAAAPSACAPPASRSTSACCEDEARELNVGWLTRIEHGRPWVRVKIAASLDGRTALANGASQWITGEAARADGHRWRARACAMLTGIGTVLQDDPQLTRARSRDAAPADEGRRRSPRRASGRTRACWPTAQVIVVTAIEHRERLARQRSGR